mgnify:CR=1 FL=1
MPCFYTPNLIVDTETIEISGEEFHHIVHVRRKQIHQSIKLTNGNGIIAKAKITGIKKRQLTAQILSLKKEKIYKPNIFAAFSLLKNRNDSLIIEKLTELGVKAFYPLSFKRTIRQPTKNNIRKLHKTTVAAIKQCDNAYLPKIHKAMKLQNFLSQTTGFKPFVALETEQDKLIYDLEIPDSDICLIFGPEGGFTENEKKLFQNKKISTFSIGNHIVRAETAAIAATSQLLGILLQQNKRYY